MLRYVKSGMDKYNTMCAVLNYFNCTVFGILPQRHSGVVRGVPVDHVILHL